MTNGILAVVTLGMALACLGPTTNAASSDNNGAAKQEALHHVNIIWYENIDGVSGVSPQTPAFCQTLLPRR